ncbi:DUF4286 family protein [Halioxenophilus sp. WMMB6]|uniref:DUF4286 family protein n=1 Tax=Halioxenophilus sp. WMMB6 TaxID=3073815 RepID=UPI00295E5EB8|nr:DUF4286 family protein [Halioxenophilus sp. WMMB6]
MPHYKMVVLSNPFPGREAECDEWYRHQHLQDVVALPGFIAAQRFHLQHPIQEPNPYRFMAIYDIESDDIRQTLGGLVTAAEQGTLVVSDALDTENAYAVVYEASGEPVLTLTAKKCQPQKSSP